MSMYKVPLSDLEREGLIKHGLSVYGHSQLSDVFRLGVQWAIQDFNKTLIQSYKEKNVLQAKIDSLMLEFCPEEMTQEQIAEWERNQKVSSWSKDKL